MAMHSVHSCVGLGIKYKVLLQLTALRLILGPSPPTVSFDSNTLLSLCNSYAFLISQFRSPSSKKPSLTTPDSHILGQKPLLYAPLKHVLILCAVLCLVAQLCPTLCDLMDCSLPGSSVHGILQARILEWAAMASSRGSSQPRDQTWVSCTAGRFFTI